jgi:hypothetical protein
MQLLITSITTFIAKYFRYKDKSNKEYTQINVPNVCVNRKNKDKIIQATCNFLERHILIIKDHE